MNWFVILLSRVHFGDRVTEICHFSPLKTSNSVQLRTYALSRMYLDQKMANLLFVWPAFYVQPFCACPSTKCCTVGAQKPNVFGIGMVVCVWFMVQTIWKSNLVSLDCFIYKPNISLYIKWSSLTAILKSSDFKRPVLVHRLCTETDHSKMEPL